MDAIWRPLGRKFRGRYSDGRAHIVPSDRLDELCIAADPCVYIWISQVAPDRLGIGVLRGFVGEARGRVGRLGCGGYVNQQVGRLSIALWVV